MSLNELKISKEGLISINRKLIDSRKYESNLISTVGDVNIFNSKASGFSKSNYLYKSGLELPSSVIISCYGTYASSEVNQTAWTLSGNQTSVTLYFTNNRVILSLNDMNIQLTRLELYDGLDFSIFTKISKDSCSLVLYLGNNIYEKNVPLNSTVNIAGEYSLYLGNEPRLLGENFWSGSLDLSKFSIKENDTLIYSPSVNYPLVFTKILISDGEFKLTDKSTPIANHIYEYEVSEITRSGNTMLLTAQISDDAKLEIKEIGFYANIGDKEILFGALSDFSINKGEGVPYDLVFTLNYYTSFVNVIGFPDYNSFVLNESEPCLFQDFSNINELILYIFTNLERLIRMNAMNIGYNRSQVFFKLQKELIEQQDCYYTIEDFEKIAFRIRKITEKIFNPDSVTVHNNLSVSKDGEAKNFSVENYISSNIILNKNNNWEIKFSFKIDENLSGTILTLGNNLSIQPLLVSANYSLQENKVFLHIKLGKDETENEFIIDSDIMELELGIRYYIKLKYYYDSINPQDSYYEILNSDDDEEYYEVFTKYSERKMLPIESIYVGVEYSYDTSSQESLISNPLKGIEYLNDLEIKDIDGEWSPSTSLILNGTQLLQFYPISNYYKSRYTIHDLCNPDDYSLQILETSIKGNGDLIDFSQKDGFSLCVSVNIQDNKPKILLAKTNLINKPYFLLALLNKTLYFIITTSSRSIILSKAISEEDIVSYLGSSILLTIIIKGNKIQMYKGTELITDFQGVLGDFKNPEYAFLTNFVQSEALKEICLDLNLGRLYNIDEYVEETLNNENRYVKRVLVIQGALNLEDIYYINSLLNA